MYQGNRFIVMGNVGAQSTLDEIPTMWSSHSLGENQGMTRGTVLSGDYSGDQGALPSE